jgi:hypothetical protein
VTKREGPGPSWAVPAEPPQGFGPNRALLAGQEARLVRSARSARSATMGRCPAMVVQRRRVAQELGETQVLRLRPSQRPVPTPPGYWPAADKTSSVA